MRFHKKQCNIRSCFHVYVMKSVHSALPACYQSFSNSIQFPWFEEMIRKRLMNHFYYFILQSGLDPILNHIFWRVFFTTSIKTTLLMYHITTYYIYRENYELWNLHLHHHHQHQLQQLEPPGCGEKEMCGSDETRPDD